MSNDSADYLSIKTVVVGAQLSTYWEIFRDLVNVFFSPTCAVWAQPHWLGNIITIYVLLATIFYVYVVCVIVFNIRQIKSAFYLCALSLAVGEIVLLISMIREGRMLMCVLKRKVIRHYAWRTIGTFGMDCTLTSQLVMAVTRFTAVYNITELEYSQWVAKTGIILSWIWTISMTIATHFGLMSYIWYDENRVFNEEARPLVYIRIVILLFCTAGTFLIYCALLILTIRIRTQASRADLLQEIHMFAQCVLIFFCQLSFLYANFYFGFNYLHFGSAEFNVHLYYMVRPLAMGLTPTIYLAFSTNLRKMIIKPFCICIKLA